MGFELDPAYKDVPQRIADLKAKFPEARLRPVNPAEPWRIECVNGTYFVAYAAACYRGPDDTLPAIGVAWEPFPGKTPYTKDSELQNAETAAWGRAIVAALASESKSVASAEDVRNRQADAEVQPVSRHGTPDGELIEVWPGEHWVNDAKACVAQACGGDKDRAVAVWTAANLDGKWKVSDEQLASVLLLAVPAPGPDATQVPAESDIVGELDHEYAQLGDVQRVAFDAWCRKSGLPESRADASRADVLAAIEKARELRSHTGPVDAEKPAVDAAIQLEDRHLIHPEADVEVTT